MNLVARARSLMVMGTASDVGKSVVVTGLCRLFARAGMRVAPFKSQNMSNNSAVCPGGGEIGRAQAVQAEACGLQPTVDMNPVLLKPESDHACQVVIGGYARFRMTVRDHQNYPDRAWPEIVKSYDRLASRYDLIVIEGAGGASEINLRESDVVNWRVAELADAPVLIVADIDKGGALAALVGTVSLLTQLERDRVKGFLINKFRGDLGLLSDGLRIIEDRTGVGVLGVLPYASDLDIPAEDSASLDKGNPVREAGLLKIGVVRLPCVANYTDFEALAREPDVHLQYVDALQGSEKFDILCLPGSKSTIADLDWVRASGWARRIDDHYRRGGSILGICAGYQMLGRSIADPLHVESSVSEAAGLGLLDIQTIFGSEKITSIVRATACFSDDVLSGYEIHCGRIHRNSATAAFRIRERDGRPADESEGAISEDARVLGTSIHGLFDEPGFRRHYLDSIRQRKGLEPSPFEAEGAEAFRLRAYDRLANLLAANLDISSIARLVGLAPAQLSARV